MPTDFYYDNELETRRTTRRSWFIYFYDVTQLKTKFTAKFSLRITNLINLQRKVDIVASHYDSLDTVYLLHTLLAILIDDNVMTGDGDQLQIVSPNTLLMNLFVV